MVANRLGNIVPYVRRLAVLGPAETLTDAELLDRWTSERDQAAFELLVYRHGAVVANVCRRVLQDEHAVEDAFQATFLTLARKAATISRREAIGGWLYRVAFRIACAARKEANRRRQRQAPLEFEPESPVEAVAPADDLRQVLDTEVNLLPSKYRLAVILCYLEGRSTDEAARLLGWPRGTVGTRLAWARDRLRRRLRRRGIALSGGALAVALAQGSASAALPATVVRHTAQAAVQFATGGAFSTATLTPGALSLTQGALQAMWMTQVKIVSAVVTAVVLFGVGAGALLQTVPSNAVLADEGRDKPGAKDQAGARDKDNAARRRDGEGGVRGVLTKIDAAKGTLTLTISGDGGTVTRTFNLASKNLKVTTDKGERSLDDLTPGTPVRLQLSAAEDVVALALDTPRQGVASRRPGARGLLKTVNAAKSTIEVTVSGPKDGQTEDRTFEVARGNVVQTEAGRGDLNALKPGMRINMLLADDRKTVTLIRIAPTEGEGRAEARPEARRDGRFTRLGLRLEPVSPALADQLSLPAGQGAVIVEVQPDSAGAKAGLKANDILLEFNGQALPGQPEAYLRLIEGRRQEASDVVILRKGKRETFKNLVP